jgi:hypothetical protein
VTPLDTVAWAGATAGQIAKRMPLINTVAIRRMTLLLLFERGGAGGRSFGSALQHGPGF